MSQDFLGAARVTSTDEGERLPQVHPILVVVFGTTMAELAVALLLAMEGHETAPFVVVVVDTLPYDDVITRMVQLGYSREQARRCLPRSRYCRLKSRFTRDFDFDNPLNREWTSILFEPALQRLAANPDAPGCAGTPALGRACVEGNIEELRDFFETHLQQLTRIGTRTLTLLPGVRAFVVTTYRGGFGTGVTEVASAVLRSVMDEHSEIHLRVPLPEIYLGDLRSQANAFAALRQIADDHRWGAGVSLKDQTVLPRPFTSVGPVLASDGAVALGPVDALRQEVALIAAQLDPRTQSAYNTRHVDLNDVAPFDLDEEPTHVRLATTATIRNVDPRTLQYLARSAQSQLVEGLRLKLQGWVEDRQLTASEHERVRTGVRAVIESSRLTVEGLRDRMDPQPAPAAALRSLFERFETSISGLQSQATRELVQALPAQVRHLFDKLEGVWQARSRAMATEILETVTEQLTLRLGHLPHLLLAAIPMLHRHLRDVSGQVREAAESHRLRRDHYGRLAGESLQAAQQVRTVIPFLVDRDEVARDAARAACRVIQMASGERLEEERYEALRRALDGELTATEGEDCRVVCEPAIAAVEALELQLAAALQERIVELAAAVRRPGDEIGTWIDKSSPVFDRTLVHDGISRSELDDRAAGLVGHLSRMDEVQSFLRDQLTRKELDSEQLERELEAMIRVILPLVPGFSEIGRTLEEVVAQDPARRELIIEILRNRVGRPFAVVDRQVEDTQGLRNRRDTLVVVEVPGGSTGAIGRLVLNEGIVANPSNIIDSSEDRIRLTWVREGLPYAALRGIARLAERYASYMANPSTISPHTTADIDSLPTLEPKRTNIRRHVQDLLATLEVLAPERMTRRPDGIVELSYELPSDHGFAVPESRRFGDLDRATAWLIKQVGVRRVLESAIDAVYEADPEHCRRRLLDAWNQADGDDRSHLETVLSRVGVNPYQSGSANGGRRSL